MLKSDNKVEQKKRFERDWVEYILGFDDSIPENEEELRWNISDRDLEAYYCGCDISSKFLSEGDKIKVKRYRRDNCKR